MTRIRLKPLQVNPDEKPTYNIEDCYSSRELSILFNISMSTLADYRRKGIGPKFVVFGYRNYRYPKDELVRYIQERTRTSTSATRNYDLDA